MTSRQFCKRIKENVPKSIAEFCKMSEKEINLRVNASTRYSIAEHLFNNPGYESNYILKKIEIIKIC